MSLLSESFEKFCIRDKQTVNTSWGGTDTVWVDGAEFEGTLIPNTSTEAQIAERQGVSTIYTLATPRSVTALSYDTRFKRLSDGKVFRITNDDKIATPQSAGLDLQCFTAERAIEK